MTLRFPDIGTFALIEGTWREVAPEQVSENMPVTVFVHDRQAFDEYRPLGEVDRRWQPDGGEVRVSLESVEEIVDVGRVGRYRGEPVRRLGDVVEGQIAVGLASNDRETAARLGFSGDQRFMGFNKMIDAGELTDVVEEVTVTYRRGHGGGIDG